MSIDERILEMRSKAGLTQQEMADRISVTRQAVSRWENGETAPGIDTLKLIAEAFGVSVDKILDLPENNRCESCGMPLADPSLLGTEADVPLRTILQVVLRGRQLRRTRHHDGRDGRCLRRPHGRTRFGLHGVRSTRLHGESSPPARKMVAIGPHDALALIARRSRHDTPNNTCNYERLKGVSSSLNAPRLRRCFSFRSARCVRAEDTV